MTGRCIHPGEILWKEYMIPLGLTVLDLADRINYDAIKLALVCAEFEPLEDELICKLAAYFNTSKEFWSNLNVT